MNIKQIFSRPCIIAVIGDINTGKSMLLYHLLEELSQNHKFSLYTYGLRLSFKGAREIFSVREMEQITNSLIIVDELSSLYDLDNRKIKKQIENSLRLLNHNNNILILCGTPENFKKFISAKVDMVFFKKTTIADFINGSSLKYTVTNYKGNERGAEVLNLPVNETLFFDSVHYDKVKIKYYPQYDSKKDNIPIFTKIDKNVHKNVSQKAVKKVKKKDVKLEDLKNES